MAASLEVLLQRRQVWRLRPEPGPGRSRPTGLPALDAVLPGGGWPLAALVEILLAFDGLGEVSLLGPLFAQLSGEGQKVVLIGPPYLPFPPAWRQAGIVLDQVHRVDAEGRDALWAAEQCLRSGACGAVLCWPLQADDRALRRLQWAAETGGCLGFAVRPLRLARQSSPAAWRLVIEAGSPPQLRVLKCRGGMAWPHPIPLGRC
ncbi:MAG: CDP-6-deoxy-delta-3,4-glucoseen reductase [Lysobacteraceae bacterium]|nr:MAG: CDP-6-deoxy-delta-3,4-glucoseen reductase [Xanthomonadaceae bacterium]